MVSVTIKGGLGNQLFQFAAGYNLARSLRTELQVDLSFFDDQEVREDFTPRKFLLTELGIRVKELSKKDWKRRKTAPEPNSNQTWAKKLWTDLRREPTRYVEKLPSFDPKLFEMRGDIHLTGYFQDYRYLNNIKHFIKGCIHQARPDAMAKSSISKDEAICLHVRRGDYISRPDVQQLIGHCDIEYYKNALKWMREKGISANAYIFSDDCEYVKSQFSNLPDVTIWDTPDTTESTIQDFMSMMQCKHFIISNSSYSYWAAWLASCQDSVVCYPSPWYQKSEWREFSPAPPNWTGINRL
jgi:hypothetical protein